MGAPIIASSHLKWLSKALPRQLAGERVRPAQAIDPKIDLLEMYIFV